jgi:tRNA(Ile)-lysidine synthetase-like protein
MAERAHVVEDTGDGTRNGAQIARFRLADYDPAVLGRFLRIVARYRGFRLTRGGTSLGVEFIRRGSSGHSVDLGDGLRLTREYDRFRLYEVEGEANPDRELVIGSPETGAGTATLGGRVYEVAWGTESSSRFLWTVDLDAETVVFPLCLRGPRPGDRIRTRAGSRKLKKLLNERRVPRGARDQVPVLAGADGRIVWVAGYEVEVGSSRTDPSDAVESFCVGVVGTEVDGR